LVVLPLSPFVAGVKRVIIVIYPFLIC
jgi:hypothetical protein